MNQQQHTHDFTAGAAVWNAEYAKPKALDDEQLRRFAPSIFATEPFEGMSDRYGFVPTIAVVNALREQGFVPVRASENWVRDPDKKGYAKHTLRFRAVTGAVERYYVGDTVFEIALTNSHDGSSCYLIDPALFRFACSNGLLVCDSTGALESIAVRHTRNLVAEAIEGTFRVVEELPAITNQIERFRRATLDERARLAFATAATQLRWPDNEVEWGSERKVVKTAPIDPKALLTPKRYADQGSTVWSTLNVVQEHLLKGGDRGHTATMRRHTTRKVKSISEDQRLNRALWVLAAELERRVAA
jgi:hypothetical protein